MHEINNTLQMNALAERLRAEAPHKVFAESTRAVEEEIAKREVSGGQV